MGYQMIPEATQIAGQNNNVGGASSFSGPWGGSGMSPQRALGLLNPSGIGGGGLSKGSIEAFLDPAGVDSGSYGLNLFGQRQQAGSGPTAFPNLGAASLIPKMPGGTFMPIHAQGTGPYNQMAATGAGRLFNPAANAPVSLPQAGSKPTQGAPAAAGGMGDLVKSLDLPRRMK